ncbi:helix-hairpin-helix domain-containing protein [Micrococcaceae bacterium Sec5.8]
MSSPPATGRIIVHVAGAVVRAGVVELPPGSRLHEAIAAAGGGSPDADPGQLNLAAVLEDGQKILVPRQGETVPNGTAPAGDAAAGGGPASGARPTAAGKINLNTASVEELATLPRVGPVLAQRIVDWRGQHGRFQRVEELDAVDGVGEKMLAALLPLVRV